MSNLLDADQQGIRPVNQIYNTRLNGKEMPGYTWYSHYGTTTATGFVYVDTVSLGHLTVLDQAVGVATNVTIDISNDPFRNGRVGFAFVRWHSLH
jgi:hypothetical protein